MYIYNHPDLMGGFGMFALSLAVGIVFIAHGLPKIKEAKKMASAMGWPAEIIMLQGLVEFFGGILLIVGLYTQIISLIFAIIMLGAIYMKINKWKVPFTAHDKTGWEFDLVLLAANLAIYFGGGGYLGII